MIERNKVIEWLDFCIRNTDGSICNCEMSGCPYLGGSDVGNCFVTLMTDALALLKAKEPVKPKVVDTSNSKLYHNDMFKNHYCGNCGEFLHVVNRKDMFCSQCGRAVKWE